MGTQYRVTADCPVDVGADITRELVRLNQEMSTYDESSTVSRFNRATPGGWFAVSTDLVTVVAAAAQLSVDSAGAFDITVGPLVNLWGFGPGGFSAEQPAPEQIDAALARDGKVLQVVTAATHRDRNLCRDHAEQRKGSTILAVHGAPRPVV